MDLLVQRTVLLPLLGRGRSGRQFQAPVPAIAARDTENAVERLRAMIGDKQEETVEILRSWLEENEERV